MSFGKVALALLNSTPNAFAILPAKCFVLFPAKNLIDRAITKAYLKRDANIQFAIIKTPMKFIF